MRRSELRQLPSRVVPSTEGLLDLCDAHGARGTFFVLGVVAQRYPRLVRTIVERGHEIASHGWDHTLVDALGPVRFREDVRRSKRTLLRGAVRSINRRDRRPAVLYVHPWEFDPDQPRPAGMTAMHRFRHYVGLRGSTVKLARLLAEFAFTSIAMAFPQVRPARRV